MEVGEIGISTGNLDHSQRGIQDSNDSPKSRSNTLFSFFLQGLGFDSPAPLTMEQISREIPEDSLVMKADLLISNPYMNTTEKFDELKELEGQIIGRSDDSDVPENFGINSTIPTVETIRLRSAQALGLAPIIEEGEGISQGPDLALSDNSLPNQEIRSVSPDITPKCNKPDPQFPSPISDNTPIPSLTIQSSDTAPSSTRQNRVDSIESHTHSQSHDSEDNSLQEQASQYALNMESKLRDLKVPLKIRQNTQIYEMSSEGKLTYADITFDILYSKLKKECKFCDSHRKTFHSKKTSSAQFGSNIGQPFFPAPDDEASVISNPLLHPPTPIHQFSTISPPPSHPPLSQSKFYNKYSKQTYVNGDTRQTLSLFGTGRIDGTKDFVRLNFPINLEDIYDPLHLSFENTLGAYKSSLFIRRHSIWFSFYTEAYPIQAIIMARKLILFLPRSKESVLALNDLFVKEIVPQIQQVIDDWRVNNTENNSEIPFEQDMFRALITLLGAKEKAEYHRMRQSLELYLGYLKRLKTNSRHQILSMGLEFHSQNLKSQLNHVISRMRNNLHAMTEVYNEDDDKMTESYLELMSLSVFLKKSYLYDYDVDRRHEELSQESPIYTTHNLYRNCLEKYLMDNETILKKLDLLLTLIDTEESLFRLQLNYSQNEILILNTILTILACSISFGGYLTGAFGMNLDNTDTLQYEKHSFLYVFILSFLCILSTFLFSLFYFRARGILPTFVGKGIIEKNSEFINS